MSTTITPLSTVIGVFPDLEQANRAIDGLRHTNFGYDHIRVVERGTGGFFDNLKALFTGQGEMASSTADTLIKMGMPDYEAQYYQRELDANHVLVLMNADDRPEEAFRVMRENGAFDIQSRLRLDLANDSVVASRSEQPQVAPAPMPAPEYTQSAPANTAPDTSVPPAAPYSDMPPAPLDTRQQAASYPNASDRPSAPPPPEPPEYTPQEEPVPAPDAQESR